MCVSLGGGQFFDSKFVCQSDGREVTRVRSTGMVRLKLNIVTKGEWPCLLYEECAMKGGGVVCI